MKYMKILTILLSLLILTACNSLELNTFDNIVQKKPEVKENTQNKNKDAITIWATENIFEGAIEEYRSTFPNKEVKVVIQDMDNLVNIYQESIISGATPDIFMIPNNHLGEFSGIDGLENLKEPPYFEESYFSQYPEGLLRSAVDR